jgi:signal transduction histidine kinase
MMTLNLYRLRGRFKGFLFISGILIILGLLFYTQIIVSSLRAESRGILVLYAELHAQAATSESNSDLDFLFNGIIQRTNFPIIQTDAEDNPIAWKGIGIDPQDRSPEAVAKVRKIMGVMKSETDPIPIKYQDRLLNNLYYGDSKLITQLQYLPYIEIAVVALFIVIGFFGFRSIQRSEQQFIWVGMSKETAHQIGTPLSSIMGWLEILKAKIDGEDGLKTILEMEKDVERLNKITARFSQIGSRPDLKDYQVQSIISEVVTYFRRRLPQWGKQVKILEHYETQAVRPMNKELFEWVIENLVKNSLDAIEKEAGEIEINLGEIKNGKHQLYIDISDNGRGIEASKKGDVFKPGYSTKKRGWGLGLSLAKRIIEDYHGGRLLLKESKAGQGTTMRILL